MMVFVPPNWFDGMLIWCLIHMLPVIVFFILMILGMAFDKGYLFIIGFAVLIIGLSCSGLIWYETMELPSVNEKIITVQEWQPRVDIGTNENGMMVVDSADDLMLVTTDGECYYNTEHFWFQKFNTRDPFNQLKVNGTYRIRYYGWREPFNSGFPNILNVEEVIDESGAITPKYSDYFGVKLIR